MARTRSTSSGWITAAALWLMLASCSSASAAQGDCGQPASSGATPTASDCLFILRTATGAAICEPECVCDTSDGGGITAADALVCLKVAVGNSKVTLKCPPCPGDTTTLPTSGVDWKPAASSPIARFEAAGVVIGGELYLFGGFYDAALHASARVDVYDAESDAWRRLADMPVAVTHLNPAVDGNRVWFAGGFQGDNPGPVVANVWKYDITKDSWSAGPPLPEPRGGGALVRAGRALHFFGGFAEDRNSTPGDHWALDLDSATPAWDERAPLPDARGHLGAIEHEGRIFAIGGQYGHDEAPTDVAESHVYDPQTDHWTAIAPLPTPRSHVEASTFVWNGHIVMAGGRNNQGSNDAESRAAIYDPKTDRWSELPNLPKPLVGTVFQPVGHRLVLTTGGLDGWDAPQTSTYVVDAADYLD